MEIIIIGVHSSRNVHPCGLKIQLYMPPPWKKHKLFIAFDIKWMCIAVQMDLNAYPVYKDIGHCILPKSTTKL